MDSISQAVLGSAVCLIASRGKQPRKAILIGAVIATLPDLDSFLPSDNALEATVSHRTWSHSWFVHTLVGPLLATALFRIDKSFSWLTWFAMSWLALITHSALDCFTVYGTDVFWPFSSETIMQASIFIIDPLFTLPLLIAVILCFFKRWQSNALKISIVGLLLSCSYLTWGVISQNSIGNYAKASLAKQNLLYNEFVVTPTPFNSILWRVLVIFENQYYEGFYSWFDKDKEIEFKSYPRNIEKLEFIDDLNNWDSLNRFSHSFNAIKQNDNLIIAVDLRMGMKNYYFFQFQLAEMKNGIGNSTDPVYVNNGDPHGNFFLWIWQRLLAKTTQPLNG